MWSFVMLAKNLRLRCGFYTQKKRPELLAPASVQSDS